MCYTKYYMRSVAKQWQSRRFFAPLLLIALSGVLTFVLLQVYYPAYTVQPTTVLALAAPGESPELAWPAYGQSAIATEHQGVVATHGEQAPHPTASTAKVITLLAVLEKKPLTQGEQGPNLTMTAADVELHARYVARNSTNTAVYTGMKLTQYQAMQSILLASSGNMSDTLAIWAFGSLDAYYAYANDMVKRLGATQTTIGGDASGLSPRTMSTATDMALLTLQAMKQPAIAEIAAQKTAQVPYAGTIRSSNRLLGRPGVVGLKTGETVEAGGNFLLALRHTDAGHSQYVAVVVYGAELASIATADSYTNQRLLS